MKVFEDALAEEPTGSGSGAFAAAVQRRFPEAALEHEAGLLDPEALERFLTRLFASAGLRSALKSGGRGLRRFHARYRWVLAAHDPPSSASRSAARDSRQRRRSASNGSLGAPPSR